MEPWTFDFVSIDRFAGYYDDPANPNVYGIINPGGEAPTTINHIRLEIEKRMFKVNFFEEKFDLPIKSSFWSYLGYSTFTHEDMVGYQLRGINFHLPKGEEFTRGYRRSDFKMKGTGIFIGIRPEFMYHFNEESKLRAGLSFSLGVAFNKYEMDSSFDEFKDQKETHFDGDVTLRFGYGPAEIFFSPVVSSMYKKDGKYEGKNRIGLAFTF
jgi:hypothetical protein